MKKQCVESAGAVEREREREREREYTFKEI